MESVPTVTFIGVVSCPKTIKLRLSGNGTTVKRYSRLQISGIVVHEGSKSEFKAAPNTVYVSVSGKNYEFIVRSAGTQKSCTLISNYFSNCKAVKTL